MPYFYTDSSQENSPTALPDVEVFYSDGTPEAGYGDDARGFYYAFGSPGCLWDSEPSGPYTTEAEALREARESAGFFEHGIGDDDECEQCEAPELWVIALKDGRYLHFGWAGLQSSCNAWVNAESAEKFLVRLRQDWEGWTDGATVVRLNNAEARRWSKSRD